MLIFNMNMRKIKRIGMVAFKALLFKKKYNMAAKEMREKVSSIHLLI